MIPNNNLSVLPWYKSRDEQNARRWWVYGRVYPLYTPAGMMLPFQIMRDHRSGSTITRFRLYRVDGTLVGNFLTSIREAGITIVKFESDGYDVIIFPGSLPVFGSIQNGQYYCELSDGTDTWFSDVFTVVNDIEPYLKIEWWDTEDFIMDAARVVYKTSQWTFKNVVYLPSVLAKPEYTFEEEGEERDGVFYPVKQISEKRYRFAFWAPEYLLDVMRLIRMSDYINIYSRGEKYAVDSFLISPEWEENGDIAAVSAEFETATVAKKVGVGYIRAWRGDYSDDYNDDINGDFNDDFSDDFFNQ